LDPNTISTHVWGVDDLDHVLKNFTQDAKALVEVVTVHSSNDFHVSNANINFGQKVDVKAGQMVSSSFPPILVIHDLGYVLAK